MTHREALKILLDRIASDLDADDAQQKDLQTMEAYRIWSQILEHSTMPDRS